MLTHRVSIAHLHTSFCPDFWTICRLFRATLNHMDALFIVVIITFCASTFGVAHTHFDRAFLPHSKLMTEAFINHRFCHKNQNQVGMISSQSVGRDFGKVAGYETKFMDATGRLNPFRQLKS